MPLGQRGAGGLHTSTHEAGIETMTTTEAATPEIVENEAPAAPGRSIVRHRAKSIELPGFPGQLSSIGWKIPARLSYEAWEERIQQLVETHEAQPWWMGDACNFGERKYGEQYAQAVSDTGYSQQTLWTCAWVARAFPYERRRPRLSYSHHRLLAGLPEDDQEHYLDLAETEELAVTDLRERLREDGKIEKRERLATPRILAPELGNGTGAPAAPQTAEETRTHEEPTPAPAATVSRQAAAPAAPSASTRQAPTPPPSSFETADDLDDNGADRPSVSAAFAAVKGKPEKIADILDGIKKGIRKENGGKEPPALEPYLAWLSGALLEGSPPKMYDAFEAGYDARA